MDSCDLPRSPWERPQDTFEPPQDLDLLEIQVDRGDGKGFTLLTYDTTPGYNDTAPLPAAPVKWTYKAIYRVGDAQVGVWSNPVSITVGG